MANELYFHTWCPRLVKVHINYNNDSAILQNADIPRHLILFSADDKLGDKPNVAAGTAADSSNQVAMIHMNLSSLNLTVDGRKMFNTNLNFTWQTSAGERDHRDQMVVTRFYDPNKSSYLRGYNLVQEFFGKTYGVEIPITAEDYFNNWFMIPINLNLDSNIDNIRVNGNLPIDFTFSTVENSPIALPNDPSTNIKARLLCLDQYLYKMSKGRGIDLTTI